MHVTSRLDSASTINNNRAGIKVNIDAAAAINDGDNNLLNDSQTGPENGDQLVGEFIVSISQILCFPFAIDANEEIIAQTYKIIKELNLFNKLLSACMAHSQCVTFDIPMSLIARLILTDENLVLLMIDQLNNSPKVFNPLYIRLNGLKRNLTVVFL